MAIIPPILNSKLIESLRQRNATTPVNLRKSSDRPIYSGFINLRLRSNLGLVETNNLAQLAEEFGLNRLARFLFQRPDIGTARLIQSISLEEVVRIESRAAEGKFPPATSLASFWRLDTRQLSDDERNDLVKRLNEFRDEIELAYTELAVYGPDLGPGRLPLEQEEQWYRLEAPYGVDADWICTKPSGQGDNVQLVDIEQGWVLSHQELDGRVISPPITGEISSDLRHLDHGTAVLGSVIGIDDGTGVLGIAPNANPIRISSHYGTVAIHYLETGETKTAVSSNVANAIYAAIPTMASGDILLLEVERGLGYPTEIDDADFNAIQAAASLGIIVIEAAGNAAVNLDSCCVTESGPPPFAPGSARSAAIMVGASQLSWDETAELEDEFLGHDRFYDATEMRGSNYGDRIDCFAMGRGVSTAAGVDSGSMSTTAYTLEFGGTSAAAAIIAGVALVVQSMSELVGARLLPTDMRALLSNPLLGTPSNPGAEIKSMPNLRCIAECKGYVAALYLQKASTLFCELPDANPIGTSLDILTCSHRAERPTQYFSELNPLQENSLQHCRIINDQVNYVYARIRNCGSLTANNVVATVYRAPLATLITPDLLKEIGRSESVAVPVGFTPIVTDPIPWRPTVTSSSEGHTLIVDVAPTDERQKPLQEMQWQEFLAILCNSNQVAQRSVQVVEVRPRTPEKFSLPFLITGAPDQESTFTLEWVRQLPEGIDVQWQVPRVLFDILSRENCIDEADVDSEQEQMKIPLSQLNRVFLSKVKLPASARYQSQVLLTAADGFASGIYSLAVRQLLNNNEVGRVTWIFKPSKNSFFIDLIRRLSFLMR